MNAHHRHHGAPVGCKFCLGVYGDGGSTLHGVAICGRPVAKALDNGLICEINRVCTDGTYNACSMLYGACVRVARAMGYHKVITYILESENGASLRASNFVCEGTAGGTEWTGKRYAGKNQPGPREMKTRWAYTIRKEDENDLRRTNRSPAEPGGADHLCEFANNLNCKSVDANDIMRFPRVDAVPVVRCESCENWDTDSGLTARMCNRLGRYTTRYWFCADGREKHDSDKPNP